MVIGRLLDLLDPANPPNTFTKMVGELVRQARTDSGLNQKDLAQKIYSRQAAISDIENGKRYVSSAELIALSAVLDKPILYFFPEKYRRMLKSDFTDPELNELLQVAQKLDKEDLKRLVIQTKALARNHHQK